VFCFFYSFFVIFVCPFTGVGPKAYRPTAVEQALVGQSLDEDALKAAVQTVADGIDVLGDIHASPDYRAHLARVLTRRAVLQAAERASG
jgi:carbon-monoxide dehydrogenase medium subunit